MMCLLYSDFDKAPPLKIDQLAWLKMEEARRIVPTITLPLRILFPTLSRKSHQLSRISILCAVHERSVGDYDRRICFLHTICQVT